MTVQIIGDSHAKTTFKGLISDCVETWLGPVTLERASHPEEPMPCLPPVKRGDSVVFVFGEIDVRCHVLNRSKFLRKSPEEFIESISVRFIDKIMGRTIDVRTKGTRIFIMSVVPPTPAERLLNKGDGKFMPVGSDQERASWTRTMNSVLERECIPAGLNFIDVHSLYVGDDGMLPKDLSDGGVHIGDSERLRDTVRKLGWKLKE